MTPPLKPLTSARLEKLLAKKPREAGARYVNGHRIKPTPSKKETTE